MANATQLPDDQRRALDRLKPSANTLGLYLAGGTAIAFHLRHRVSRDIDLFSRASTLDLERVRSALVELPDTEVTSMTDAALRLQVAGTPVDVVSYPYPLLRHTVDGPADFPTASLEDLATMKLSAVARRGIRRDFWDLYEILRDGAPTLDQALASYVRRYGVKESDLYHVLRALTYFDDAEADTLFPEGMTASKWAEVKAWFVEMAPAALRDRIGSV